MRRTGVPAAVALLLVVPLLGACGTNDRQDCPAVAQDIDGRVDALRDALPAAGHDPRDAATALRRIQQKLDDIGGRSLEDRATAKAVGDVALAVSDVKNELDKGEPTDIRPLAAAAGELTAACPKKG